MATYLVRVRCLYVLTYMVTIQHPCPKYNLAILARVYLILCPMLALAFLVGQ